MTSSSAAFENGRGRLEALGGYIDGIFEYIEGFSDLDLTAEKIGGTAGVRVAPVAAPDAWSIFLEGVALADIDAEDFNFD